MSYRLASCQYNIRGNVLAYYTSIYIPSRNDYTWCRVISYHKCSNMCSTISERSTTFYPMRSSLCNHQRRPRPSSLTSFSFFVSPCCPPSYLLASLVLSLLRATRNCACVLCVSFGRSFVRSFVCWFVPSFECLFFVLLACLLVRFVGLQGSLYKLVPPFGVHSDRLAAIKDLEVSWHSRSRSNSCFFR